jgi:hypothetical protein
MSEVERNAGRVVIRHIFEGITKWVIQGRHSIWRRSVDALAQMRQSLGSAAVRLSARQHVFRIPQHP